MRKEQFETELRKSLDSAFFRVTVLSETESTNTYLKREAEKGAPEGTIVIALSQSGGRGRRGRSFFSAEGGLYMSILLRPTLVPDKATLITAAAAVAVARAIEGLTGLSPKVKWVNDILLSGKKLAGILTEAALTAQGDRLSYAVLGIGINVAKQAFPPEISAIATSLGEHLSTPPTLPALAVACLSELEKVLSDVTSPDLMDAYRALSFVTGKTVTVIGHGEEYTARVSEILDDGSLSVIDENGNEHILSSGEISVRL